MKTMICFGEIFFFKDIENILIKAVLKEDY